MPRYVDCRCLYVGNVDPSDILPYAGYQAFGRRFLESSVQRSRLHATIKRFDQLFGSDSSDQIEKGVLMSNAKQVNLNNFESEVLESSVPVVVDFYADWCAPCRMLGPVLDRVSTAFVGKAKIVKVNIDREPGLARQFNVTSIPTLAFVLHGEVVGQSAGLPSESQLKSAVQRLVDQN